MSHATASKMKKMTLNIPENVHRTIKAQAALRGQTMRDFIVERALRQEFPVSENVPNAETIAALQEVVDEKTQSFSSVKELIEHLNK